MGGEDFDSSLGMVRVVGEQLAAVMAAAFDDKLIIPVREARTEVG